MDRKESVIIIGSGPAGLTAALYAARANFSPLVFEGIQPGGQLTITTDVEKYPGFPEGILGPDLMDRFRKQAQRFDARTLFQDVTKVDFGARPFNVWSGEDLHLADSVIIATGASAKWLGLPSERAYMGHGVSACATCDGFFFKGLEVAVVGGGDTALEEANFLTRFASKVTIIHRRDRLRASKIMQDRTLANPKIAVLYDSVLEEILGRDDNGKKSVTGIRIHNVADGTRKEIPINGVFMGIGHQPNTSLFTGQIDLDGAGYIAVRPGTTKTNVEGVFAAGDVSDPHYRQAVTAAGTGCMAAMDAERYLESIH